MHLQRPSAWLGWQDIVYAVSCGLIERDLSNVDLSLMVTPVSDDSDRSQAVGAGNAAQQPTRRLKIGERQPDLSPVIRDGETGLIVLPGQDRAAGPQVDVILLIIPADEQPNAAGIIGRIGQIHSYLDEPAVIRGADRSGHMGVNMVAFANKIDLSV